MDSELEWHMLWSDAMVACCCCWQKQAAVMAIGTAAAWVVGGWWTCLVTAARPVAIKQVCGSSVTADMFRKV
jgi:hypothetical protein